MNTPTPKYVNLENVINNKTMKTLLYLYHPNLVCYFNKRESVQPFSFLNLITNIMNRHLPFFRVTYEIVLNIVGKRRQTSFWFQSPVIDITQLYFSVDDLRIILSLFIYNLIEINNVKNSGLSGNQLYLTIINWLNEEEMSHSGKIGTWNLTEDRFHARKSLLLLSEGMSDANYGFKGNLESIADYLLDEYTIREIMAYIRPNYEC